MKCVMVFLVLTLVVLMAEPGESKFSFGRFMRGMYQGVKEGVREYGRGRGRGRGGRRGLATSQDEAEYNKLKLYYRD